MISDDSKTIALIGSAKSPIKVACSEFSGVRTLDIRRHYFDKSTKELRPTTKGITVTGETFRELVNVLAQNNPLIMRWLDGQAGSPNDSAAQRDDRANKAARLNARFSVVPVEIIHEVWKGNSFFSCSSAGGKDIVHLNEGHLLTKALDDVEHKRRGAEELVALVVIAYVKAKNIFQGSEEPLNPQDIFDLIEFNWGLYLSQLLSANP